MTTDKTRQIETAIYALLAKVRRCHALAPYSAKKKRQRSRAGEPSEGEGYMLAKL